MKTKKRKTGYFQRFQTFTMNRMMPSSVMEKNSLTFWRARILFAIFFGGLLIFSIALVPIFIMIIKGRLWGLAVIDVAALIIAINLLLSSRLKYETRAAVTLLITYALGLAVIDVGEQLLEKLGYNVLKAKNGRDALDIYKEKRDIIDIVVLDMIMPEMNGGDVYDKLKESNPEIKVILSSGYSVNRLAQEILDRGCNGFIQKPFNLIELSHKLREILDKK